jgi:hypothetical protein
VKPWKPRKDPPMLKSLRCRCGKPLTEQAVVNEDPFCSTVCCRLHHGTELPPPERGVAVGASS